MSWSQIGKFGYTDGICYSFTPYKSQINCLSILFADD